MESDPSLQTTESVNPSQPLHRKPFFSEHGSSITSSQHCLANASPVAITSYKRQQKAQTVQKKNRVCNTSITIDIDKDRQKHKALNTATPKKVSSRQTF